MAQLSNGTYIIYNAANTSCVMDVSRNGLTDGSNIQIWTYIPGGDAQIFKVGVSRPASAGTEEKRIVNRLSGKCLDVDNAQTTVGTNVQIWSNVDINWQGQRLLMTDSGTIGTVGDQSYTAYYISMSNTPNLVFAPGSASAGSNVALATKNTSDSKQLWYFVPVSPTLYDGLFEIRSMLDTRLALDVTAAGRVNGTNVQIFSNNGTNAQKFYITQEENIYKWSIRAMDSGRYVDVDSALARNETNVQIWDDNDTRAQRWRFTPYGTTTINGIVYPTFRIGSYVTSDGQTYSLDVKGALAATNTNVQIYETVSGALSQIFALVPTSATDATMPVPYGLSLATSFKDSGGWEYALSGEEALPYWRCADAWVTSGPNHYEWRSRYRYLNSMTGAWTAWSAWTPWDTASTTQNGVQVWENQAVKFEYEWDDYKNCEYQFQVRSAGAQRSALLHGPAADKKVNWYRCPEITWEEAGWSPEGLRIAWNSDYDYGTTNFDVKWLKRNSTSLASNILAIEQSVTGTWMTRDTHQSALIPLEALNRWPADGDTINVRALVGYDQMPPSVIKNGSFTVRYNAGSVSIIPTFVFDGNALTLGTADLGETKCWLQLDDGKLFECYSMGKETVGETTYEMFDIPYPSGKPYSVFLSTTNSDGTQWGTKYIARNAEKGRFHAFSWSGGSAYIEHFTSGNESYTVANEVVNEVSVLDSRENETVSFGNTTKVHYQISGVIHDGSTSALEQLEAAVAEGHVIYRSPVGEVFEAAIISYNKTVLHNRTEVSLELVKETV